MPEDYPFAKRTNWGLTPNQLFSHLRDLKKSGTQFLDLTESNPTHCGFSYPREEILSELSKPGNMVYDPSPRGHIDARRAIARYYESKGVLVDPKQIYLTSSSSEAYSILFRLLLDPEEHVLFPRPSYPLFEFLVDLNDVHMDTYPLVYENKLGQDGWSIDFKELEAAIHPKTKAIVLVNPNNPTGSFITESELDTLNIICKKWNVFLICDEVFLSYKINNIESRLVSLAENKDVLAFTIGGLSKALALPQMKLSWIIVNGTQKIVESASERLEIILDTYLSVNTPVQNALKNWLALQPRIHREILERITANYEYALKSLEEIPDCQCLNTEGGWYVTLRLPSYRSEEEWVLDFLSKDHVFVHPGYFFDFDQEAYVVISLLPQKEIFQEGVNRILKRVTTQKVGVESEVES